MADNIRFTDDKKSIIALWKDVFGDTEEEILFFLDYCKNYSCLGYFEDNKLVSMLFLVDCEYCTKKGKYVYAVSTYEQYRKRGFSSALIEYSKGLSDFLWLIPANDRLFEFYGKLGFKTKLFSDKVYTNKIGFNETDEITAFLYEGSDYKYPKGMIYSEYEFPEGHTGIITSEV